MLQAYGYSQVNMLGGSIGLFGFSSDNQGYVSGGSIGSMDTAGYGSLYFSEGTIANAFFAQRSSQVYFSGGSIGRDLYVFQQGHVTVSGGSIGQNLVTANDGIITINGSGFAIDGQAVGYGELTSIYGGSYWGDEPVRHLTGRLTSGELLDNDFYIGGNSKIELVYTEVVPVPSAVILGSLGLTFSGWLLKRKRMI